MGVWDSVTCLIFLRLFWIFKSAQRLYSINKEIFLSSYLCVCGNGTHYLGSRRLNETYSLLHPFFSNSLFIRVDRCCGSSRLSSCLLCHGSIEFPKEISGLFFCCMPPYLPLLHLVQSWTFNCSRNIGNCYAWRISTPFVGNRTMAMIDMSFSHMWCVCVSVVGVIIYYFQKNVLHFHRIEMPSIHVMVNYHLYCRRTSDLWWT